MEHLLTLVRNFKPLLSKNNQLIAEREKQKRKFELLQLGPDIDITLKITRSQVSLLEIQAIQCTVKQKNVRVEY